MDYNIAFLTTSQIDFAIGTDTDGGSNLITDPMLVAFSADGDPTNDDLGLQSQSPAIDSGPAEGTGPSWYSQWADLDNSQNDRGATGGRRKGWR